IMRLARISFAGITSAGLRPGDCRPLTTDELVDLRRSFGVPRRIVHPSAVVPDGLKSGRAAYGASAVGKTMSHPIRGRTRPRLTKRPPARGRKETGGSPPWPKD